MLQRFLDPATLASISRLDLVAKTVVDGFVAGPPPLAGFRLLPGVRRVSRLLPRATTFATWIGTSSPAPTAASSSATRARPIPNCCSCSTPRPPWASAPRSVTKLDYARFVAASLCYMANTQRDAAGLIVFDEDVKNYVAPSTRQGQLFRLLHAIEKAEPGTHTDFAKPFVHFQNFLHRRGIVVVMSRFLRGPRRHRQDRRAAALPRQ